MRKLIYYSIIALLFVTSCRKDDNIKVPDLERVAMPLIKKDETKDLTISAQAPEDFSGTFTLDLYFPDTKPEKMDLVVVKNGNTSNIKTIQADITTYPTTFTVTGEQLKTLFGADIVLGDKFEFGADVYMTGSKKFPAFGVGAGYSAGVASLAGSSTSIRYEAICSYISSVYSGNFEVLVDEWEDYGEGDIIEVTQIDETHVSFTYPATGAQPIIIAINPATNETSVAKQVYGNYSWNTYGPISVESIASSDNFVAPCDEIISVRLKHTVSAGSYGDFAIKLKKVN